MYFDYKDHQLNALLRLTDNVGLIVEDASIQKGLIHMIWNQGDDPVCFDVDGSTITLGPDEITTVTYVHSVRFHRPLPALTVLSFNREFYCIKDHDHEVSCNGLLFMGARDLPILSLDEKERSSLQSLLQVFEDEFQNKDNIQGEMLQMLLKRFIIKCTRLARAQTLGVSVATDASETIRKFNVLVDEHYKSLKQVADYADLMFKSPKTLSNVFKQHGSKSPLQLIHDRVVIEARRQLLKTSKSAKEIAFDLGFDNVSSFNKLFKKCTNSSPVEFRKQNVVDREKSTIIQE
ncbi:MAG: helix-turn-helix domain-containing protein [Reichenbachiella sp.]|uniref:helix-turn-helix domain-containing protein n=1 Tax=Reichenbachiella sp. TaxID=2184521 RepID=UPI002966FE06|nr:helix-turn-helix domain-containing protein [Reichenbachiella sp.]MDW3211445.1 helix-turn-helix domain-containing protein [Reichenbachiella sp.]